MTDWHAMFAVWSLPVVGAFNGWFTTHLAIRMLFRPRRPVRIFGFTYQAPLPKRQAEIAGRVGEIVEDQLLTLSDLKGEVVTPEMRAELMRAVEQQVEAALQEKRRALPGVARKLVGKDLVRYVRDLLVDEVEKRLEGLIEGAFAAAERNVSLRGLVARRVAAFELEKLEEVVFALAARELRLIEIFCGVLGFAIGLVQMAVSW